LEDLGVDRGKYLNGLDGRGVDYIRLAKNRDKCQKKLWVS